MTSERFKKLARQVAREYERKGYSKAKAEQIGRLVAGKVYWEKRAKKKRRRRK